MTIELNWQNADEQDFVFTFDVRPGNKGFTRGPAENCIEPLGPEATLISVVDAETKGEVPYANLPSIGVTRITLDHLHEQAAGEFEKAA